MQVYKDTPYQNATGGGDKTSQIRISCHYLVELGPQQLVLSLPVSDLMTRVEQTWKLDCTLHNELVSS